MFEVKTIQPGAFVYALHGAYVGRVEAVNDECMRIRAEGPPFRTFYVPRSEVIGMLSGGEVFLSCSRSELEEKHWQRPPHGLGDDEEDERIRSRTMHTLIGRARGANRVV